MPRPSGKCSSALRSLPLLPNTIRLEDGGLLVAGYARTEGRLTPGMAFFVNGLPKYDAAYPIHDPAVAKRFAKADGQGFLACACITRPLAELREVPFLALPHGRNLGPAHDALARGRSSDEPSP